MTSSNVNQYDRKEMRRDVIRVAVQFVPTACVAFILLVIVLIAVAPSAPSDKKIDNATINKYSGMLGQALGKASGATSKAITSACEPVLIEYRADATDRANAPTSSKVVALEKLEDYDKAMAGISPKLRMGQKFVITPNEKIRPTGQLSQYPFMAYNSKNENFQYSAFIRDSTAQEWVDVINNAERMDSVKTAKGPIFFMLTRCEP